ncbi:hypothetical protein [Actinomadura rupiterrae]|uniref:hypothetical protein n=1 Tax=Actinomadura rupiterrae TaxID=559627 RepID=UPI0020A29A8F|nr:hypothetical protein [Actinomadura rupiterrae]MCP2339681.1 putative coiled-coil protein SlyX [Actinomadura rupiterrae]
MTTLVLVVLCVVVGSMELWAGRQSKEQARAFARRVDELNDQVTKQNSVLVTVGEQLTAELSRVKRDVLPALDSRLRDNSGQVEELARFVHQADTYLRSQSGRLQELEQQRVTLAALRRKLAEMETSVRAVTAGGGAAVAGRVDEAIARLTEVERGGAEMLELQRALTRTLEDVEDVVAELLQYTEGELDSAVSSALAGRPRVGGDGLSVTATGRLWSRDEQLQDILGEMYEACLRANGLQVRFRTVEDADGAGPGVPDHRRYFLGGRRMEELAGAFTALLISTGADLPNGGSPAPPGGLSRDPGASPALGRAPEDEAALKSLLRVLYESAGAVAQIGPLLAVRTREELVAAVLDPGQSLELENDEVFWDPSTAIVRLRRLPTHQLWELTAWGASA